MEFHICWELNQNKSCHAMNVSCKSAVWARFSLTNVIYMQYVWLYPALRVCYQFSDSVTKPGLLTVILSPRTVFTYSLKWKKEKKKAGYAKKCSASWSAKNLSGKQCGIWDYWEEGREHSLLIYAALRKATQRKVSYTQLLGIVTLLLKKKKMREV